MARARRAEKKVVPEAPEEMVKSNIDEIDLDATEVATQAAEEAVVPVAQEIIENNDEEFNDVDNNDNNDGVTEEAEVDEEAEVGEEEDDDENDVYKLSRHRKAAPKETEPRERRRAPAPASRKRASAAAAAEMITTNDEARESAQEEQREVENMTEEERKRKELEARLDAALTPASRRTKKLAGDDLEALQDEAIAKLRDDMRNAALKDAECNNEGTPAINKVRLLSQAVATLQKAALADSIFDGNLLESVRMWLEPLPDASLPSYEIQKAMFSALVALPIKTIHLRESGLGRVVLFYNKSKRPHSSIKRMAQKLIGDWTRPIIGRSDNYRDRRVMTAQFDPRDRQNVSSAGRQQKSSYEESAERKGRAAIPAAAGISYQVAPVSSLGDGDVPKETRDSQLRRMKAKLLANRGKVRKTQVSVEGKGLN